MDKIKRTVIGMDPHWWEVEDLKLQIDDNPSYIDSMGEARASVSGEITARKAKDPCCSLERIPEYSQPDPAGFERWIAVGMLKTNERIAARAA
jgi:hypothetical protein